METILSQRSLDIYSVRVTETDLRVREWTELTRKGSSEVTSGFTPWSQNRVPSD